MAIVAHSVSLKLAIESDSPSSEEVLDFASWRSTSSTATQPSTMASGLLNACLSSCDTLPEHFLKTSTVKAAFSFIKIHLNWNYHTDQPTNRRRYASRNSLHSYPFWAIKQSSVLTSSLVGYVRDSSTIYEWTSSPKQVYETNFKIIFLLFFYHNTTVLLLIAEITVKSEYSKW